MLAKRSSGRSMGVGAALGVAYVLGNEFVRAVAIGAITLSAAWWCLAFGMQLLRLSGSIGVSIRQLEVGQQPAESPSLALIEPRSTKAMVIKWTCAMVGAGAIALTGHAAKVIAALLLLIPALLLVDGLIYLHMKSRLRRLQGYAMVLGRATSAAA